MPGTGVRRPAPSRRVLDWLEEPAQPSMRALALRELEGRPASDPDVREAVARAPHEGWASEILAEPLDAERWYEPKYVSPHWKMLALSDLAVSRAEPAVAAACERWMAAFPERHGGLGGNSSGNGHPCVVGNLARALIRLGYEDDPRVTRSLEWIVDTADPKGGWSCFGRGRNLDSWEGLSALAELPRPKRSAAMQRAAEAGAEFFLERELHRQGGAYAPWLRLHYPVHYYYDVLVGLDVVTRLGYGDNPRLRYAADRVLDRRRPDGRWPLDAAHPDVTGALARAFRAHPRQRPVPWTLEAVGAPSKMVTFRALRALGRLAA